MFSLTKNLCLVPFTGSLTPSLTPFPLRADRVLGKKTKKTLQKLALDCFLCCPLPAFPTLADGGAAADRQAAKTSAKDNHRVFIQVLEARVLCLKSPLTICFVGRQRPVFFQTAVLFLRLSVVSI